MLARFATNNRVWWHSATPIHCRVENASESILVRFNDTGLVRAGLGQEVGMNIEPSAKERWAARSNTPLRETMARTPSLDWDGPTSEAYPCAEVQSVDLRDADEAWERLLDEADELPASEALRRLTAFEQRLANECSDQANRNSVMVRSRMRRHRAISASDAARMATTIANHHQRALEQGLTSTLTQYEWAAVLESHQGTCTYCGTQDAKLTIDHVVALNAGGPNAIENVVASCIACNCSKNDSDVLDWLDRRGLDVDDAFRRMHEARARRGG